jgi:putative membrane protein
VFLGFYGISIISGGGPGRLPPILRLGPGMMSWWGPMAWFGPVGMILFWVLLVLLIILLIRGLRSGKVIGREGGAPTESALEILKKRYARGEINKEEYLEKKKDLEGF